MRNCSLKIAVFALAALLACGAREENLPDQAQIVDAMVREQAARFEHFESYTRLQRYSATAYRFGLKAEMVVRVHRDRTDGKTYEIVSRRGSPVIQNHVFDELLAAEMDAGNRGELLTPANYSFHLTGQEEFAGKQCYLLETDPKHKDKRLLKGRIWVNAEDYGIVHIEGKPSESLSFWVGRPVIEQDFQKIAGYWWASQRRSYVDNFWVGKSDLVVDYSDYRFDPVKDSPADAAQ